MWLTVYLYWTVLSQNLFLYLTSEVHNENTGKVPKSVRIPSMFVFLPHHFLSPEHPSLLTFMCMDVQRLQKNFCSSISIQIPL